MSEKSKPPTQPPGPHMEKPVMQEPQEEFIADQSVPSASMTPPPLPTGEGAEEKAEPPKKSDADE